MNTREMILEIAFQGFLEEGFEKISLNELIKRTGLTKGAFYYHFNSKDELLGEILRKYFHSYIENNIDHISDFDGSIVDKMNFAIKSITNIHARIREINPESVDPKAFLLLFQEGLKRDEQLREHNLHSQNKLLKSLTALISQGQKDGEIRDDIPPKEIAYLLNATVKGSMFEWTMSKRESLENVLKENIQTFISLIIKT